MSMPVTTTFTIEGHRIEKYLGVVRGIIVRSPTIVQGVLGSFKSIIGGRIGSYTNMCEQARQQAYDLMIEHALQMGANAVIGFHYDASEVVSKFSATEVLCYGTAVIIAEDHVLRGDFMFTRGVRAGEQALAPTRGMLTLRAQVRFNPLNTFAALPAYALAVGGPSGALIPVGPPTARA